MSSVIDGKLVQTSVSQIESADETQTGGCLRRWWFDVPQGIRPEQNKQQSDGDVLHGHLAHYLRGNGPPVGRVRMGKVARATILKGDLPAPGADLFVEQRFDGQPKFSDEKWPDGSPKWNPLVPARTIVLAGVPLDGFIDLSFRRGDVPEVWDHKTSTNAESLDAYAKPAGGLILTDQMPVYVDSERGRRWPDARRWRIVHHYVSRSGAYSFIRAAIVTVEQVAERIDHVEGVIRRMGAHAAATNQDDVPFNRRACRQWLGCPHQSVCRAFKENLVDFTQAEQDIFNEIDKAPAAPSPAADDPFAGVEALAKPAAPEPAPADDEEAAALKALEVARAKKAAAAKAAEEAKRAAAEAEAKAKADEEKKRKLKVVDVPGPAPEPAKPADVWPACACGAQLSAENASRLQGGAVKHVGCPKDAAPTPLPAPEPKPAKPGRVKVPSAAETDEITVTLKVSASDLAKIKALFGK
jgi:hypothetical protein